MRVLPKWILLISIISFNLHWTQATIVKDETLTNIALQTSRKSNVFSTTTSEFRPNDIIFVKNKPHTSVEVVERLANTTYATSITAESRRGNQSLDVFIKSNPTNAFRLVQNNKSLTLIDIATMLNIKEVNFVRPTHMNIDGSSMAINDVIDVYAKDLLHSISVRYINNNEYFFYENERIGATQLYNIIFQRPNFVYDFSTLQLNGMKLPFNAIMHTLAYMPNLNIIYGDSKMAPLNFLKEYPKFKGKLQLELEGVLDNLMDVFKKSLKYTIVDFITLPKSMVAPYHALKSLTHIPEIEAWRPGPEHKPKPLKVFLNDVFPDEDPKQNLIQVFYRGALISIQNLVELLMTEGYTIFGDMSYVERLPRDKNYSIKFGNHTYTINAFLDTYGRTNEYYEVLDGTTVMTAKEVDALKKLSSETTKVTTTDMMIVSMDDVSFRLSEIAYNLGQQKPRHVMIVYEGKSYTPEQFVTLFRDNMPETFKIQQNGVDVLMSDVFKLIDINITPQFLNMYKVMNVPYKGQIYTKDDILNAILENTQGFSILDNGQFRTPINFKEHHGDNVPEYVIYYNNKPIKPEEVADILDLETILEEEFYPILYNGNTYTPLDVVNMLFNQQPDRAKILHKEKEYTPEEYKDQFPSTKFQILYNDFPIKAQDLEQIIDFDLKFPKSKLRFFPIKYKGTIYSKEDILDILIQQAPPNVKILHEGIFYLSKQFKRKFGKDLPVNFAVVQNRRIIPSKLIPTIVRLGDSVQADPKIFPNIFYGGKEYTPDDILNLIITQNPADVTIALRNKKMTPKQFEKTYDGIYPITFSILFKNEVLTPEQIFNIIDFENAETTEAPKIVIYTTQGKNGVPTTTTERSESIEETSTQEPKSRTRNFEEDDVTTIGKAVEANVASSLDNSANDQDVSKWPESGETEIYKDFSTGGENIDQRVVDIGPSNDFNKSKQFPYVVHKGTLYSPRDILMSLREMITKKVIIEKWSIHYNGEEYVPAEFVKTFKNIPREFKILKDNVEIMPAQISKLIRLRNHGFVIHEEGKDGKIFPHLVINGVVYTPQDVLHCLINQAANETYILHDGRTYHPTTFKDKFNDKPLPDFDVVIRNETIPKEKLHEVVDLQQQPFLTTARPLNSPRVTTHEDEETVTTSTSKETTTENPTTPMEVEPIWEDKVIVTEEATIPSTSSAPPTKFPYIVYNGTIYNPYEVVKALRDQKPDNVTIITDDKEFTPEDFYQYYTTSNPDNFDIYQDGQYVEPANIPKILNFLTTDYGTYDYEYDEKTSHSTVTPKTEYAKPKPTISSAMIKQILKDNPNTRVVVDGKEYESPDVEKWDNLKISQNDVKIIEKEDLRYSTNDDFEPTETPWSKTTLIPEYKETLIEVAQHPEGKEVTVIRDDKDYPLDEFLKVFQNRTPDDIKLVYKGVETPITTIKDVVIKKQPGNDQRVVIHEEPGKSGQTVVMRDDTIGPHITPPDYLNVKTPTTTNTPGDVFFVTQKPIKPIGPDDDRIVDIEEPEEPSVTHVSPTKKPVVPDDLIQSETSTPGTSRTREDDDFTPKKGVIVTTTPLPTTEEGVTKPLKDQDEPNKPSGEFMSSEEIDHMWYPDNTTPEDISTPGITQKPTVPSITLDDTGTTANDDDTYIMFDDFATKSTPKQPGKSKIPIKIENPTIPPIKKVVDISIESEVPDNGELVNKPTTPGMPTKPTMPTHVEKTPPRPDSTISREVIIEPSKSKEPVHPFKPGKPGSEIVEIIPEVPHQPMRPSESPVRPELDISEEVINSSTNPELNIPRIPETPTKPTRVPDAPESMEIIRDEVLDQPTRPESSSSREVIIEPKKPQFNLPDVPVQPDRPTKPTSSIEIIEETPRIPGMPTKPTRPPGVIQEDITESQFNIPEVPDQPLRPSEPPVRPEFDTSEEIINIHTKPQFNQSEVPEQPHKPSKPPTQTEKIPEMPTKPTRPSESLEILRDEPNQPIRPSKPPVRPEFDVSEEVIEPPAKPQFNMTEVPEQPHKPSKPPTQTEKIPEMPTRPTRPSGSLEIIRDEPDQPMKPSELPVRPEFDVSKEVIEPPTKPQFNMSEIPEQPLKPSSPPTQTERIPKMPTRPTRPSEIIEIIRDDVSQPSSHKPVIPDQPRRPSEEQIWPESDISVEIIKRPTKPQFNMSEVPEQPHKPSKLPTPTERIPEMPTRPTRPSGSMEILRDDVPQPPSNKPKIPNQQLKPSEPEIWPESDISEEVIEPPTKPQFNMSEIPEQPHKPSKPPTQTEKIPEMPTRPTRPTESLEIIRDEIPQPPSYKPDVPDQPRKPLEPPIRPEFDVSEEVIEPPTKPEFNMSKVPEQPHKPSKPPTTSERIPEMPTRPTRPTGSLEIIRDKISDQPMKPSKPPRRPEPSISREVIIEPTRPQIILPDQPELDFGDSMEIISGEVTEVPRLLPTQTQKIPDKPTMPTRPTRRPGFQGSIEIIREDITKPPFGTPEVPDQPTRPQRPLLEEDVTEPTRPQQPGKPGKPHHVPELPESGENIYGQVTESPFDNVDVLESFTSKETDVPEQPSSTEKQTPRTPRLPTRPPRVTEPPPKQHPETTPRPPSKHNLIIKDGNVYDEIDIIRDLSVNNPADIRIVYDGQQYTPSDFINKFPDQPPLDIGYTIDGKRVSPYFVASKIPFKPKPEDNMTFPNIIKDGKTYTPKDVIRELAKDPEGQCIEMVYDGKLYTPRQFYKIFGDKELFPNNFQMQVSGQTLDAKVFLSIFKVLNKDGTVVKNEDAQRQGDASKKPSMVLTYIQKVMSKEPNFEIVYEGNTYKPLEYIDTFGDNAAGNFKILYLDRLMSPKAFYKYLKENLLHTFSAEREQNEKPFPTISFEGEQYTPRLVIHNLAVNNPKGIMVKHLGKMYTPMQVIARFASIPTNFELADTEGQIINPSEPWRYLKPSYSAGRKSMLIESKQFPSIISNGEKYTPEEVLRNIQRKRVNVRVRLADGQLMTVGRVLSMRPVPREFDLISNGKRIEPTQIARIIKLQKS